MNVISQWFRAFGGYQRSLDCSRTEHFHEHGETKTGHLRAHSEKPMSEKMKYPFEATFKEIEAAPEAFVSAVFSSLASEFLTLPKGDGFVDYAVFESGYEALKMVTRGFAVLPRPEVLKVVLEEPISLVVLRAMLGFSPPEWAYLAAQRYGPELNQGFVRTLDRKVRVSPLSPLHPRPEMMKRIEALVTTACDLVKQGCPKVEATSFTSREGRHCWWSGCAAQHGGYRRALRDGALRAISRSPIRRAPGFGQRACGGRIGKRHRGATRESRNQLRKTQSAERFPGFDQAPDS